MSAPLRRFALLALLTIASLGCTSIPGRRAAVDAIELRGTDAVDETELKEKMASRETSRFLGVFKGVIYDYEIFDRYVLERDLQRIERHYRARGYYKAKARAGRVFFVKDRQVKIEIIIEEGPPVIIRRVDLHGTANLPPKLVRRLKRAVARELAVGERLEEESFQAADESLRYALADSGYAFAQVRKAADVDINRDQASVGFWIKPGVQARFGEVRIQGLEQIPEAPVRRALDLRRGDPYSVSELEEAERQVLELGVFSSVDIEPQIPEGEPPTTEQEVPLLVRVRPSRLRSVQLGGGVQIDMLRTDVHLLAGWEDRNFLGGLRRFLVELVPGVVVYPTRMPTFEKPERLLPQIRLRNEFRQPGLFEARIAGIVRAQGNIYPVLLSPERDPQAPILGYRELRLGVGADRTWWRLYAALSHNIQINSPFTYLGILDRDLETVLISYPELMTTLDLRDDRVKPRRGIYVSNILQFAGAFGDARDIKVQPELRGYVPIGRFTLTARGTVGLLIADNYGDTVKDNALDRFNPTTGVPGNGSRKDWVRDIQITYLRGFFSGGTGSNRGYGAREVGPHGIVPFYNPDQSAVAIGEECDPQSPNYQAGSCDLPLGGFTLWEVSVELRFPLMGPLGGAVFVDASDVAPEVGNFRFNRPHVSVGPGARYDTPIGPVRLDVGYRIPGLQAPDSPDEGQASTVFDLPIAVSFGIGEAF